MIRFVLVAATIAIVAMMTIVLILSAIIVLACLAVCIGVPVWMLSKHWNGKERIAAVTQYPIDRLKNLYVEGKIDLFEFERAVAHLLAVEK